MENLLIMGINTRPMVNSALKLKKYKTYSVSYFKTLDFNNPFMEKHILDQKSVDSCGLFENNYSPLKLLELSRELIDEIDEIVLITGINSKDFKGNFSKYKNKIRGNKKTDSVDDKFKFYKKIKNKFDLPYTFKINDIYELKEILKEHNKNQFILKPLQGSGGLGFFCLNYERFNQLNDIENLFENISLKDYILQEYISGINLSSSVLGSKNQQKNIFNTRLITENDLGNNSFAYSGNIIPLDYKSINIFNNTNNTNNNNNKKSMNNANNANNTNNTFKLNKLSINNLNKEMEETSENLIKEFNLIGSNGIDFILDNDGNLKVIEINPRLQGTYELVQEVMNLNMLDAHIKACEGEIVEIPKIERYAMKKIIYSHKQTKIGNLIIPKVYDVPYEGVKIEKNQPLVTLISSNSNLNITIEDIKKAEELVYKNIK